MNIKGKPNQGVSVVTCTHLPDYMDNVLRNYAKQTWKPKELIVILNNDKLNRLEWKRKAAKYQNIRIYQLPERMSLGRCLNFGIRKAKYDFIAKFDHDDYYARRYLAAAMGNFQKKKADIVGKRTYFTYLEHKKLLIIRFPNREHKYVPLVHGGTFVIKRNVFNSVKFSDRSVGEDVKFLKDCRKKGFKIYSAGKLYYVYMRRNNEKGHTWKINDGYLLKGSKIIGVTENFKKYARRKSRKI